MFCVLLVEEGRRHRGSPRYKKPKMKRVDCAGSHYDIITARAKKGRLDFNSLNRAAAGRPIVCQVDINIDENDCLIPFDSKMYKQHMEISTVLEVLRLASRYKPSLSVAFSDKNCQFAGCLIPLMEVAKEVYIITNSVDIYNEYAAECYRIFGAAPIISDGTDVASKCNAVFSPDGIGAFPSDRVVFTPKKEFWHIDGDCITAINGCPDGVDKIAFAGALYELCGVARLKTITAEFMTANGVRETLERVAERICLDMK